MGLYSQLYKKSKILASMTMKTITSASTAEEILLQQMTAELFPDPKYRLVYFSLI